MTFISTVIARQGIILTADSKELFQGGQLLWKDFDEILQAKGKTENDATPCIAPNEITDKFKSNAQLTQGRVVSTDGAIKLFQVDDYSAILVSGVANPNGHEFSSIIQTIKDAISASPDKSFANSLTITFDTINPLITADTSADKLQSEYLFCGYDRQDRKFKVHKLFFHYRYLMENGQPKKDENGQIIKEYFFHQFEKSDLLNTSGWTKYVGELGTLNQQNLEIDLPDAFELSKRIIDLVVTIEQLSNRITGIGGKIYHAAITEKGFFWVDTVSEVKNLLR